jgi:hypothetical protein
MLHGGIDEVRNTLRIDISNSKKIRFTLTPQEALDADKSIYNELKPGVKAVQSSYGSKQKVEKERYSSQAFSPSGKVYRPSEETILTNTKADKKPNKNTYIPRMDDKLDEIIRNQKSLEKEITELVSKNTDLNSRMNLILQEIEVFPKLVQQTDFLIVRLKKLIEAYEESLKNKSLFERIFGGK